jgi:hypothetical protein
MPSLNPIDPSATRHREAKPEKESQLRGHSVAEDVTVCLRIFGAARKPEASQILVCEIYSIGDGSSQQSELSMAGFSEYVGCTCIGSHHPNSDCGWAQHSAGYFCSGTPKRLETGTCQLPGGAYIRAN